MATNANASENFESNFLAYPVQSLELRRVHSALGAVSRTARPYQIAKKIAATVSPASLMIDVSPRIMTPTVGACLSVAHSNEFFLPPL
jgi:hypothetical protein